MKPRQLYWFREDLRIEDNWALFEAAKAGPVVALFLIVPKQWQSHDIAGCRIDFWYRNLVIIQEALADKNIPLLVKEVSRRDAIAKTVLEVMQENDCESLFVNRQYEYDESQRDLAVANLLKRHGLGFESFDDEVVLAPGTIRNLQGEAFKVYTPFKKKWLETFKMKKDLPHFPAPRKQDSFKIKSDAIPLKWCDWQDNQHADYWPAGTGAAKRRLKKFIATHVKAYASERDFPSSRGTSKISAYLSAGVISCRQVLQAVIEANGDRVDSGITGAVVFIQEIIWREFYKHITHDFPRVSRGRAFKLATDKIRWEDNPAHFNAWCEGRTGYPLVDAAMRQLRETGWMHNRLRMVVAMFLVKDLLIDWRRGEAYFMQHLIDGDFSANNGGWQWSAGTGVDAQPYFRIFNPVTQGERFDPEGDFIRQYCPELASLDGKSIHWPDNLTRKRLGYPMPLVEHKAAREKFLARYKRDVP